MSPYSTLPRNAKACILTEPLWALFGPLVAYYAPMYQKARGLDPEQMGLLNSAALATSFLFFVFAAPITNRLGRRWSSLIFDTLAWSVTMVLWAFARTFSAFFIAAVLNSFVRIVIVAWNLLITEDAEPGQRSTIHGWMHLINSLGGLTTFAGGLLVAAYGVLNAMPVLYLAGAGCMTFMFIVRHLSTQETATGRILMAKSAQRPFLTEVVAQFGLATRYLKSKRFISGIGFFVMINAVYTVDYYRVLYFGEAKLLDPATVAFIPAFSAITSLLVFFFVMPRFTKRSTKSDEYSRNAKALAVAALVGAISRAAIIISPTGSAIASILASGVAQAAFMATMTFRDATFMNGMSDMERGSQYALIQAMTFLISIPAGWFAGWLFARHPALPYAFSILVYVLCAILALRVAGISSRISKSAGKVA